MKELIKIPGSITKVSLKRYADEVIEMVKSGNVSAMDVHVQAKALEEITKAIKDGIKEHVLDEAPKYTKDEDYPVQVKMSSTGDRLDYESDQEYKDIKTALKAREDKLKKAYQLHSEGLEMLDTETGELVPVCNVKSLSEQTVTITFKKG